MRRKMSPEEEKIYNDGERLVFGLGNDVYEDIRHRSSYVFFRKVIDNDMQLRDNAGPDTPNTTPVTIIDLGCGVGHGCETLSEITHSIVTGVDISDETLDYARSIYARPNIGYSKVNLVDFIPQMPEFDYVVSRNVFEHIPKGIELASLTRWRKRLIFDVPYNEAPGNRHHVLFGIREETVASLEAELFYQDLYGVIYDRKTKPAHPNIMICICSHPDLPKVTGQIQFPFPAWRE